MYPEIDILINMVIEEGVKIVFTSAGNPKTWTEHLHEHGIIAVSYTHLRYVPQFICREAR